MDLNDPRRRLQVLNKSNPSIRVATGPKPQPQLQVNAGPARTPQISVAGPAPAPQNKNYAPQTSWNRPEPPKQGWFGKMVSAVINPISKLANEGAALYQTIQPTRAGFAEREAAAKKLLTPGGGLGSQGGVLGGEELKDGAVFIGPNARQNIGKTVGTGGQVGSLLVGGGSGSLTRGIFAGAGANTVASAGEQITNKGSISPKELAMDAGVGGFLGGLGQTVGKLFRGGDTAANIAKETNPAKLIKKYGVPDNAASFLASETNPETVRLVMDELVNSGIPIKNWWKADNMIAAGGSDAADLAAGMFDAANPPITYLPPGVHAPGGVDPVPGLVAKAQNFKSAKEFDEYVRGLEGEERVMVANALNGKTPEEFYTLVKGSTPSFERGYGQPKPSKVARDAQKVLDETGIPAYERKAVNRQLPAPAANGVTKGEGFTMTDEVNKEAAAIGKQINKLDQQISDIAEGKVSATREVAVALQKEREELIDKVVNPDRTPVGPQPVAPPAAQQSGTAAPAVKGDIAPESPAPTDVSSKSPEVATSQNASPAVEQVLGKLDEAAQLYNPEAKLYSKQRGAALFRGEAAAREVGGEAGYFENLKAMKGVKKKTGFQPIEVEPSVRDEIMSSIQTSGLMPGEKINAQSGMLKVFGVIDGAPTPSERALIRKVLGDDVADAVEQHIELAGMSRKELVEQLAGVPRTAMTIGDLSVPRQAGVLMAGHPIEGAKAFFKGVGFAFKPNKFKKAVKEMTEAVDQEGNNYSDFMDKTMNLKLPSIAEEMAEEAMSSAPLLTKVPIYGKLVEGSNRSFSGTLSEIRYNVAKNWIEAEGGINAVKKNFSQEELELLGEALNTLSGRGGKKGGFVDKHASILSKTLFSGRLWASRLNILNPYWYVRLKGPARKEAIRSAAAFSVLAGSVLELASHTPGVDVGWDPRSADFAKIKVGNTRYDILGGLQQNIRVLSQMYTGEKVNSDTGEVTEAGEGFGGKTKKDWLFDFAEGKANPLLGFASKLLDDTNDGGFKDISKISELSQLFVPLGVSGAAETVIDTGSVGKGIAMSVPSIFGAGVQTYGSIPTKDKGSNGEYKGKMTPDIVTGLDGKALLDENGKVVKVKFPEDATELEKQAMIDEKRKSALSSEFKRSLSKEDQALMKLTDEQLKSYVSEGKIDQARFDQIKRHQKTAESQGKGNKYAVPDGITSELGKQYYQKFNSMTEKDQKYWLSEKNPPDEFSKTIATLLNKERSEGLSEFKPSNALAKAYADYEKDLNTHPEYTEVDKRNKAKSFQTFAYKLNYSQSQRDIFHEGSSSDVRHLIENKQISKEDLDAAIKMDDELYNSGLTGTLKFSKKFRREFGYGLPSGGNGPNKGGSGTKDGDGSGSTKTVNAHLEAFIPGFAQGRNVGDKPEMSRKTRTTPSFKNVNLPKAPSAPKVNIKL